MDVLALYGLLVLTTLPPLIPNSALLVTTGVLASRGEVFLPLVLVVVGGSALLGDLLMYLAARRFGGPVRTWMRRNPRRRALLAWTSHRIQRYGLPFVIVVRFLPSGRIVGALASGVLRYPLRKYALGAAVAEATWATYSVGLGYLGAATTGRPLYAVALGFGVSCAVAAIGTAIQWATRRRALHDPPEEGGGGEGGGTPGGSGGIRGEEPPGEGWGEGRGGRASAMVAAPVPA
ncbi:DedA family protein [Streptomyces angustmyceticus]|uniref:DedA family protein n=1 Tax=Streptomyces angustmyceticus TaxID=285578 RepID=UPI0021AEBE58|nr:VTT domain-containing protein [Streptomyces angustmyceticus]